jgi:hypothetical protein
MARLGAAMMKADEIHDGVANSLADFCAPDTDDTKEARAEIIEELMGSCHELLVSLQLAHEATSSLEPNEVLLGEDDLVPDEDGDDD